MSTPGIHVAVHTDEAFLFTGAWMDFTHTSMRRCLVDDSKRPGSCGGQCLRWCTWEFTHPHQTHALLQNPLCPLSGEVSVPPSSGLGPAELSSLKKDAQSPRLGIGTMPIPMRSWTSLLCRCMHRCMEWWTSPPATWRSFQSALHWAWTGCLRATCLPNGRCTNGVTEFGMTPLSSCWSCRAPDVMRVDFSDCS